MTRDPHLCHHPHCQRAVPEAMFSCRPHWYQLPKSLRDAIWAAYVPGQERRKDPTGEYLEAARAAIDFWEAAA